MHPARAHLLDLLNHGPVRLVVDPDLCGGLPEDLKGGALFVQVADEEDLGALDDAGLELPYRRSEDEDGLARVPWDATLILAGLTEQGMRSLRVRPGPLPTWLGDATRLAQLVQQLGLDEPQAGQWRLGLADAHLQADAERQGWEPDKAVALRALLERGDGHAWLLVDGTAVGVGLPTGVAPAEAIQIDLRPQVPDLCLDEQGVAWQVPGRTPPERFVLPWHAVGAMRDDRGEGWYWPVDLPGPVRRPLEQRTEVWPLAVTLRGVPLGLVAQTPVPVAVLPTAFEPDKARAVRACHKLGDAFVLADLRQVDPDFVPPSLRGRPLLALPLRLPGVDSAPRFATLGLSAVLPDPNGQLVRVRVPWSAIFLATSGQGRLRVYCWPDDYPDELTMGLFALKDMAEHGGQLTRAVEGLEVGAPTQPLDDGTRVGLGRSPRGEYVMVLQQPVGKADGEGSRPVLQVEFCLDLPRRH
jgi:hypothetical protein